MSSENPRVLLEGEHRLYPKGKSNLKITITEAAIAFTPNGSDSKSEKGMVLKMDDVIGADTMKGKTEDDTKAYLTIYAYPLKKKTMSKTKVRRREAVTLIFDQHDSYNDNWKASSQWKAVLMCLVRKISLSGVQDLTSVACAPRKRLLVLVNPFSGPGKALTLFQQRVVPLLAEAGIHYHMVVTEHAGHATKMMKSLNLDDWYGLVIVSGDGLVYEVVNGLMDREDWETAIKIPLGALPGGSGNALSCALLHRLEEPYLNPDSHILSASYLLAKHEVLPMDLVAVDTCTKKRLYSFLAIAWGLIADVDIESEKYRSMGDARFTLGAFIRIIGLRKYKGRISFLPVDENYRLPEPRRGSLKRSQSEHRPREDKPALTRSQSTAEGITNGASPAEPSINGTAEPCQSPTSPMPQSPPMSPTTGLERTEDPFQDTANHTEGHATVNPEGASPNGINGSPRIVPTPLLNPLDQPVPDNWVTIEDDFVFAVGVYLTHLSKDMITAPESKLDDGHIYLAMCRAGVSRLQVLSMFGDMETGKVSQNPNIDHVIVKAFRIEPLQDKGIITVDGEAIDYGPVQAQMLPGMARIMTPSQV